MLFISIKFKIISFNEIQNHIISYNSNIIGFYKTVLYMAIEKNSIEIVKILLMNDQLDINVIQNRIFQ